MSMQKILVVDDSRTVRSVVKRGLFEAGYEVITAADGLEAIELAKTELPDLAVLDICMPFMDGYGFCDELKGFGEPLSSLPIIFLTSLESHALELLGDSLGAYLHKPVDVAELVEVVEAVIGKASGNQQGASVAKHPTVITAGQSTPNARLTDDELKR